MSVQRATRRERALQALSRASVQASGCLLRGDLAGCERWELAELEALSELARLDGRAPRLVLQLDAFPDALPLFPCEVRYAR